MKNRNIFVFIVLILIMLTLVACSGRPKVSVDFVIDIDGTKSISTIRHYEGERFYLPSSPIRQGYIFWGWYLDEGLNEFFEDGSVVSENITLYSKWIATDYDYLTLALNNDRQSFAVTGTALNSKVIEIPENVHEYPITRIEQYAFKDKTNLEKIYIPASVRFIGENAFENCLKLTIYIRGNTMGSSWNIHNRPVYFDFLSRESNLDYDYIIHNGGYISIEKSIRRITEVIIPDRIAGLPVHVIGNAAFAHNSILQSVEVPATVQTIEYFAFYNCSNLSSILINGNTIVHNNSFNECLKATFYIRPSSLPTSYWNIHKRPVYFDFLSRESNSEYDYIIHNGGYISIEKYIGEEEHIVIPDEINELPVLTIGNRAFENNSYLKSVAFSETLINVGFYAFKGCYNLESIKINNINTLNKNAFVGCYQLDTLILGKNINADILNTEISPLTEFLLLNLTSYTETDLDDFELMIFLSIIDTHYFLLQEFWNCCQSYNYDFPSFESVLNEFFYEETELNFDGMHFSNITIDEDNEFMTSQNGVIYNHDMTTLLYYPPNKHESSFTLPESVKIIESMAFSYNQYLEEVILNQGLETIKINAFKDCYNIKRILLPDSVQMIESFAFMHIPNLTIYSKALTPNNNYMELWDFNTVIPSRNIEKYAEIIYLIEAANSFLGIFVFYDEDLTSLNYSTHNVVWGS